MHSDFERPYSFVKIVKSCGFACSIKRREAQLLNGELVRTYWPKRRFHDSVPSPNLQLEIRNVLRVVSDPPSRIILGSCDLLSHFPLRRLPDQPGATPAVFLSLPPPLPKPFHFQHSSSTNHRHRHFISTHNQTSSQLFPSIAMARTKQTARKVLPTLSSLSHLVANVVAVNWWQRSAHRHFITTSYH